MMGRVRGGAIDLQPGKKTQKPHVGSVCAVRPVLVTPLPGSGREGVRRHVERADPVERRRARGGDAGGAEADVDLAAGGGGAAGVGAAVALRLARVAEYPCAGTGTDTGTDTAEADRPLGAHQRTDGHGGRTRPSGAWAELGGRGRARAPPPFMTLPEGRSALHTYVNPELDAWWAPRVCVVASAWWSQRTQHHHIDTPMRGHRGAYCGAKARKTARAWPVAQEVASATHGRPVGVHVFGPLWQAAGRGGGRGGREGGSAGAGAGAATGAGCLSTLPRNPCGVGYSGKAADCMPHLRRWHSTGSPLLRRGGPKKTIDRIKTRKQRAGVEGACFPTPSRSLGCSCSRHHRRHRRSTHRLGSYTLGGRGCRNTRRSVPWSASTPRVPCCRR